MCLRTESSILCVDMEEAPLLHVGRAVRGLMPGDFFTLPCPSVQTHEQEGGKRRKHDNIILYVP